MAAFNVEFGYFPMKVTFETDLIAFELGDCADLIFVIFNFVGEFYENGYMVFIFDAQTVLTLHNEQLVESKMTKEVILGHMGCRGSLIMDGDHFYHKITEEVRG